jgi:glyoxalase family protein
MAKNQLITGLHHVTALASSPQQNVDFYVGVGLRLVKKTINFDAPDVYHLYYGDETGTPGSIMTFSHSTEFLLENMEKVKQQRLPFQFLYLL